MSNKWTEERIAKVSRLIRSLYAVVKELEEEFMDEERKFTLDGHLVGSIGEVVAAYSFGLTLYPPSIKTHDAESEDGKKVQIKLTGGIRGVALSSEPDYLIVLQLQNCKFDVIYNGPGAKVWAQCKNTGQRQRPISLKTLRDLNTDVADYQKIFQHRELPDLSGDPININLGGLL